MSNISLVPLTIFLERSPNLVVRPISVVFGKPEFSYQNICLVITSLQTHVPAFLWAAVVSLGKIISKIFNSPRIIIKCHTTLYILSPSSRLFIIFR